MTLDSLRPGDRFTCCGLTARLVKLGPCSATVEVDKPRKERAFDVALSGEHVEIPAGTTKRIEQWSLKSPVGVIA